MGLRRKFDGDDGDGGDGDGAVDAIMGFDRGAEACREREGSLWKIDVRVVAEVARTGEVVVGVGVLWIVVSVVVVRRRGNSDLGSLLERIAVTVVRTDRTPFHQPCPCHNGSVVASINLE